MGGRVNRNKSAIYVMNADGSNKRRLTHGGAAKSSPTWSPDGKRVAFLACRPGCSYVYVVSARGQPTRRTRTGGLRVRWSAPLPLHTIAWSPRGGRIAYDADDHGVLFAKLESSVTRRRDRSHGLRLVAKEPIELAPRESQGPAWSPDGKNISFQRFAETAPGLYVTDVRGVTQRRLTKGRDDSAPAWSPNGRKIVFARAERLFVATSNGTNPRRITSGRLSYGAADWQALPGR